MQIRSDKKVVCEIIFYNNGLSLMQITFAGANLHKFLTRTWLALCTVIKKYQIMDANNTFT